MTGTLKNLYGRADELAELRARAAEHSIVSVVGAAGVGKTSLLRAFAHGEECQVVDLTELAPGGDLDEFIIKSLDGFLSPEASPRDRRLAVRALLQPGSLLVLDNAEHVADEVRDFIDDELLASHRFVVASRERLNCRSEHVLRLEPFAVTTDDAVGYLAWRADRLGGSYRINDDELDDARALASELDGLPLAMDLAAGRLSLLRPAQLLARLKSSGDVLSGEGSRSLSSALSSTWELATEDERAALCALSTLEGSFDVALAEAVIGDAGLTHLQRLRDRSMVAIDPDGRARLLNAIRQFARGHRSASARDAAVARLVHHLHAHCDEWLQAIAALEPLASVDAARAHKLHLEVAVTAGGESSEVLQCAAVLGEVARLEGSTASTLRLLGGLKPRVEESEALCLTIGRLEHESGRYVDARDTLARGTSVEALLEQSYAEQLLGELEHARELAELGSERASGDRQLARAELQLAGVAFHLGEYDRARERFELALRHARRSGDRRTEARVLQNLGVVLTDQMQLDLGRRYLGEAILQHQVSRDLLREAWAHNSLGVLELRAGDADAGTAALERASQLFDAAGHRTGAATTRANLAMIAVDSQRWDDGVRYALEAIDRASAEEDLYISSMSKLCLAICTWLRGDRDGAGSYFRDLEPSIAREGHVQLALSWDAAFGGYLAAIGDDGAEAVFARGEALLGDDHGHDVYVEMFRIARAHTTVRELRQATRDRTELTLELLELVTGSHPSRSEPLRFALRLLQHETPADLAEVLAAAADASDDDLLVVASACAFRPPGGEWHSLAHTSLWALFDELVAAHESGAPVDVESLREAMWPGEVLTDESASNRLHVSLSKLRKLGLKRLIQRSDAGYSLDSSLAVTLL